MNERPLQPYDRRHLRCLVPAAVATAWFFCAWATATAADRPGWSLAQTIAQVQPKMVKIYGAGGFRGLEAYQSGFFISPAGHVLTTWSYVLDADPLTVVCHDGRHLEGKLLGVDSRLEIAVLATEQSGAPFFDLQQAVELAPGARVLAFSNLFGIAAGREPLSVQHGLVAAVARLDARRGVFPTAYSGPVYVLDVVTNNPGAQGGALVDYRGRLAGMLGKELRSAQTHTWLNYALPASRLRPAVERILSGGSAETQQEPEPSAAPANPVTLSQLGIVLVPEVVPRTPPYVDQVAPSSPAAQAGLLPDDLVVMIDGQLTPTCRRVREQLERIDRSEPVRLTVFRGQQTLQFVLRTPSANEPPRHEDTK